MSTNSFAENNYIRIWMEEGILVCKFADDLEMDLEIAKSCVQLRIQYCQGKSFPLLVNMTGIKSVTKEAREYMSNEGSSLVKAGALIIASPVSRVIGNIFLSLNRPPVPTRLFNNEKAAVQWLRQYANK